MSIEQSVAGPGTAQAVVFHTPPLPATALPAMLREAGVHVVKPHKARRAPRGVITPFSLNMSSDLLSVEPQAR